MVQETSVGGAADALALHSEAQPAPAPTKASATVANPPPATTPPGVILIALVEGLSAIAAAEGSQPKPAGKAWGIFKQQLDAFLDELGIKVAPPPSASLKMPMVQSTPQQRQMHVRKPYNQGRTGRRHVPTTK